MRGEKTARIDMLQGSLMDKIMLFALPLAASSILQQLFNSADVAVVGRFAGNQALAAVGGNSPVINLLLNLFVGLSVGANVVIANYVGQGKREKAQEAVHTVFLMALISGFLLIFLGFFASRPILTLINTPADVLELATIYLKIYFAGMPFIMVYNFGAAILRSIGDTKKPLLCLIVSGTINVCLNLVFVIVFELSVVGVGLATVISNGISAVMVVRFLLEADEWIRLDLRKLRFYKEQVIRIVQVGIPAGIQGMVFSISNVCIQSGINGFGTDAVAGSAAALNFEFFTYFVTSAFSQAAVTFTSQNYGAGNLERCRKVFFRCLAAGTGITGLMGLVFILFRRPLVGIYTTDSMAVQFALMRMMHVQIVEFMPCIYEVTGGVLRGLGHSMLPAVLMMFGTCVVRVVWVYTVFQWNPQFEVLMSVYPVTWLITIVLLLMAYFYVAGSLKKKQILC
ncbi:MAG: MATE family efflux transporter [Clostridiales bacterium]|nr:MATE family efflux transporter [Clostridiales bacterium]